MSIQSPANLYTQGFGSRPETVEVPVVAQRDPGANDYQYPIGKRWINDVANNEWSLTSVTTFNGITTAVWTVSASGSLLLSTITTQDATVVVPTNGNINLSGSGSTTTVGSGSTATVELTGLTNHAVLVGAGTTTITKLAVGATGTVLAGATAADPAFTGSPSVSGSVTAGTTITATLGNITATNGNLVMSHVGNKLVIPASSSATCSAGTFTLGGAATTVVSNSAVTANSLIYLTTQALGTVSVASTLAVTAISAATNFTVTPSQSTDTSTVAYLIIN